jgi:hypothetical protein
VLTSIYDLVVGWPSRRSWFGKLWSIHLAASCALLLWVGIVFRFMNFSGNY